MRSKLFEEDGCSEARVRTSLSICLDENCFYFTLNLSIILLGVQKSDYTEKDWLVKLSHSYLQKTDVQRLE